jgi:hypothetical protein
MSPRTPDRSAPLSFCMADAMPSRPCEPPPAPLLQLDDALADTHNDRRLAHVEFAWAPTERMSL